MDPSVNHSIEGHFTYGTATAISEGCNFIIPLNAALRLGNGCHIGRYVEIGPSGNIEVGDNTSIQDRSILVGDVSLGRYCILSLNVLMTSGVHYYERWPHLLIRDQDSIVLADPIQAAQHSQPITVEEDCWIGMNAVIMPGVTVGRGCVVGSNAVVTGNLPPYSVAAGVPAKVIKQRLAFAPPRRIDWSDEEHIPYFYSGFELTQAERTKNKVVGGHIARRRFALWLDYSEVQQVCLSARSTTGECVVLEYEGAQVQLADEWIKCRFSVKAVNKPVSFIITGNGGSIAVREAWVE
jgi:acetyltransferase-like isoleucine patch superfamily enzyme